MSQLGRYVRVYYSIRTDEKFLEIYPDDQALACWVRLLMIADEAYPEPAHIPLRISKPGMRKLADAKLITLLPNDMFRVNGLDAERKRRAEPRAKAAAARWNGDANAMHMHSTSNASAMRLRKHESSDASTAIAEQEQEHKQEQEHQTSTLPDAVAALLDTDDDPHLATWYRVTASFPSAKVTPWLDQLAKDYGAEETSRAIATVAAQDGDRSTLLSRADAYLRLAERNADRQRTVKAAKRELDEKAKYEEMPAEQRAANLRRLREEMEKNGLLPRADYGDA